MYGFEYSTLKNRTFDGFMRVVWSEPEPKAQVGTPTVFNLLCWVSEGTTETNVEGVEGIIYIKLFDGSTFLLCKFLYM